MDLWRIKELYTYNLYSQKLKIMKIALCICSNLHLRYLFQLVLNSVTHNCMMTVWRLGVYWRIGRNRWWSNLSTRLSRYLSLSIWLPFIIIITERDSDLTKIFFLFVYTIDKAHYVHYEVWQLIILSKIILKFC